MQRRVCRVFIRDCAGNYLLLITEIKIMILAFRSRRPKHHQVDKSFLSFVVQFISVLMTLKS